MKLFWRTFTLSLLIVFFFSHGNIFAAPYPLTAAISNNVLSASMTSVVGTDASQSFKLVILKAPFSHIQSENAQNTASIASPEASLIQKPVNGTVSWNINLNPVSPYKAYYVRVERASTAPNTLFGSAVSESKLVWAGSTSAQFYTWPLDYAQGSDGTGVFSGKLDTGIVEKPQSYVSGNTLTIDYSSSPLTATSPQGTLCEIHESIKDWKTNSPAIDGTYYCTASNLSPNTNYFLRHTISGLDGVKRYDFMKFNSSGVILDGSKADLDDFNDRSYRLLAPFPGLAVLLDPDLCAEQRAVGKVGQICDINDFLNYGLSLLIGVSAVVLVFRLMYEGYRYIVTDVPFLKMNAKSKFGEALLGLLLALSAFLILNTINPKLVSNEIAIDAVNLGVEEQLALYFAGYDADAIKNLSPDQIRNLKISYEGKFKYIRDEYIPARDRALPTASKGVKTLITAQTAFEGFYPTTKSYKTNNPGNIGNTDLAPRNWDCNSVGIKCFPTLGAGIQRQYEHINGIVSGTNSNYKIGKTYAAIGGAVYDGSLHQYLKIYATGAQQDNNYLSYIISYFKKEGYVITGYIKMTEIAALK